MSEEEFWRQQRDALLMQVSGIEKRLGIVRSVCCPACHTNFQLGARREKQMHDRSRDVGQGQQKVA